MKNIIRDESGSAIVLVALSMIVLLAMSALVIDVGGLFVAKSHLEKTANAAVLSGAQELVNDDSAVSAIVNEILKAHKEESSLTSLTITHGHEVRIVLKKEVPLTFSKLLGKPSVLVEASAAAQIASMGRATGVAPVGIDEAFPLVFGNTYKLKVDQTGASSGNFGILALDGPGAKTYEENLRFGFNGEIKVGDIVETQTGNIAGKTRSSINERINACPYPGDLNHRDCSRVLLVPVYRPHKHESNQLKEVMITGFAHFYIMEPMSSKDTSITGMFIQKVDTGFTDPNAVNRGAYSIKLVE
ncbi:MAG: hypothetical protein KGZ33_07565 [Alkaliphilus sp.]|nr:hypothetical protein [Alkaliphilus sp.]